MMEALFKRLLHIPEMILVLSLLALACLPIALSKLVRDAGMSLFLPLTLIGALLSWVLTAWKVRKLSSGCILLFLGPMALYIRVGQLGDSLFELIRQLFLLIPAFFDRLFYKVPFDISFLLSAVDGFSQNVFAFSGRVSFWFTGIFQGVEIEDPAVRTLLWSLGLWLVVVWAGWQICRNNGLLTGMFPSTVMLAFVVDYTGQEKTVLWCYLALLLFLYGLTSFNNLLSHWNTSHTDYAESTSIDTLFLVGGITLGLVTASYFVSTFSMREFLDNFREKRAVSSELQAEPSGLGSLTNSYRETGFQNGLPRSYLLSAGPEISHQLAMTISTGELPPMPQGANPTVPRYYWRTLTYAIYTGAGWANSTVSVEDISANQSLVEMLNPGHRVVHAEVTFPDDASERLYWAGVLVRADVPFKAAWTHKAEGASLLDTDMLAALAKVKSYKAESILPNISVRELRESPSMYPAWVRDQFLALPDSVPERVQALARDLTASEPNAYDRALAIQNYLREYPYTLDISAPPAGRDVADYFLFDLKQGYCDYYATSMVVLARAAGLPTRLVVGYANGAYDFEHAQYIVTENYAHSWVEIYFANIGWIEFEPTASQPVILYEERYESTVPIAEASPTGPSFGEKFAPFFQSIFTIAWFPALIIFVCALMWIGFDSFRLNRLDPSRTVQLLYRRLRRLARPVTGSASRNQTAHSYAFALIQRLSAFKISPRLQSWLTPAHSEIEQLTELFSRSLFASQPPTYADAKNAIRNWSRLRWRLILANMLRIKNK